MFRPWRDIYGQGRALLVGASNYWFNAFCSCYIKNMGFNYCKGARIFLASITGKDALRKLLRFGAPPGAVYPIQPLQHIVSPRNICHGLAHGRGTWAKARFSFSPEKIHCLEHLYPNREKKAIEKLDDRDLNQIVPTHLTKQSPHPVTTASSPSQHMHKALVAASRGCFKASATNP